MNKEIDKNGLNRLAITSELAFAQANFFSTLLAFIGKELGDSGVYEGLKYVAKYTWEEQYKKHLSNGSEYILNFWKAIYDAQNFKYEILEDNEKYRLVINECAIGGRLLKTSKSIGCTKERYDWGFNSKNIPYYCTHCKINKDLLPKEWGNNQYEFKCGVVKENNQYIQKSCELIIRK